MYVLLFSKTLLVPFPKRALVKPFLEIVNIINVALKGYHHCYRHNKHQLIPILYLNPDGTVLDSDSLSLGEALTLQAMVNYIFVTNGYRS